MEITDRFSQGVDDYYAGEVPDGWDDSEAWKNPYLAGWLLASHEDNGIEWFADDREDDENDETLHLYRVTIDAPNEQYVYEVDGDEEEDAQTNALILALKDGLSKNDARRRVTYRTERLD